jgi:hypothetical protein
MALTQSSSLKDTTRCQVSSVASREVGLNGEIRLKIRGCANPKNQAGRSHECSVAARSFFGEQIREGKRDGKYGADESQGGKQADSDHDPP